MLLTTPEVGRYLTVKKPAQLSILAFPEAKMNINYWWTGYKKGSLCIVPCTIKVKGKIEETST